MSEEYEKLKKGLKKLINLKVWISGLKSNQFFKMNFGKKILDDGLIRGEFSISIYDVAWRVEHNSEILVACNYLEEDIDEVFHILNGKIFKKFYLDEKTQDLEVYFSDDYIIKLFTRGGDKDSYFFNWIFYDKKYEYFLQSGGNITIESYILERNNRKNIPLIWTRSLLFDSNIKYFNIRNYNKQFKIIFEFEKQNDKHIRKWDLIINSTKYYISIGEKRITYSEDIKKNILNSKIYDFSVEKDNFDITIILSENIILNFFNESRKTKPFYWVLKNKYDNMIFKAFGDNKWEFKDGKNDKIIQSEV